MGDGEHDDGVRLDLGDFMFSPCLRKRSTPDRERLSVGRYATEDLHLGETTLDEMCLVIPQIVVRYP